MTSELDKLSKFIEQSPKDKYKFDGKADTDKVEVCRDRGECVELSIQSAKMVDFMNKLDMFCVLPQEPSNTTIECTKIEETIAEEIQVLESIYPDELSVTSPDSLSIKIVSDEVPDEQLITTHLNIKYTPQYPEELPEFDIELVDGEISDEEIAILRTQLVEIGQESLGMPLVFSLASALKDSVSELLVKRQQTKEQIESDKKQQQIEAELERTRGTQITIQNFNEWRIQYIKERQTELDAQEDAKLSKLSNKDREELKKWNTRRSGKQLFEKDNTLANSDSNLISANDKVIDRNLYHRGDGDDDDAGEQEQEQLVEFSDAE